MLYQSYGLSKNSTNIVTQNDFKLVSRLHILFPRFFFSLLRSSFPCLFISSLARRVNFGKLLRMMNDGRFRRNTTESSRNLRLTAPKWIKSWSKFANGRFNITRYQTRERGKMREYVKFLLLRHVECNQVGIKIDYCVFHERNLLQGNAKYWCANYDNLQQRNFLANLSSISRDMIKAHVLFTNIPYPYSPKILILICEQKLRQIAALNKLFKNCQKSRKVKTKNLKRNTNKKT